MTDLSKSKIIIVGNEDRYSTAKAIAAIQASLPGISLEQIELAIIQATQQFNKATIDTENLNKALSSLKEIPLPEFKRASINEPFYYNVPKYRRGKRR
ncbi:hypothetical protein [Dysgonomonas sp. GY617]|uniref:hypothetical protein n=1 Tax=Dysgonomonas sp. GY617 TaxID=2780420 RepID=UPI0018845116|nr:hypothetical protein [Dysgonomonas sp. GY617]MBF0577715.1 hypothetical protein [Dysgonomonas sp. GY617]